MKRAILAILVIGFTLFIPQSAHGIVYGVPDDGEHPNVGSVRRRVPPTPKPERSSLFQLRTGTLIDSDVVLSASHCFVGLPETITDITFTLDEVIDADEDGAVDDDVEFLSGTPMTHPLFATGGANNTFDIAVFLLDDRSRASPRRRCRSSARCRTAACGTRRSPRSAMAPCGRPTVSPPKRFCRVHNG